MGLADRLAEPVSEKGGRRCGICLLLDELPNGERDALNRALALNAKEGGWSVKSIFAALKAEGHHERGITKSTVGTHRREHMG